MNGSEGGGVFFKFLNLNLGEKKTELSFILPDGSSSSFDFLVRFISSRRGEWLTARPVVLPGRPAAEFMDSVRPWTPGEIASLPADLVSTGICEQRLLESDKLGSRSHTTPGRRVEFEAPPGGGE